MNEEGVICESCSEYGYVSEGKYVVSDSNDGYEMSDVEADADTLASAGYGTDEDYGG
jgi:hypothetical protein